MEYTYVFNILIKYNINGFIKSNLLLFYNVSFILHITEWIRLEYDRVD